MANEVSVEILEGMLANLGLEGQVTLEQTEEGPCLQVASEDSKYIIGQKGDRLDDFQYLVNRVMQVQEPDSDRVKVDCDNYRADSEERLREKVLRYAEEVKETGNSKRLQPLNAYHRRLVHNFLVDDEEVETFSPDGSSRLKKMTIAPRRG